MFNSNSKSFLFRHTRERRGEVRPTTLLGLAVALLLIACVTLAIWNARIQSRIKRVERERDEARATLEPLQKTLKSSETASQSKTQTAESLPLADKATSPMSADESQIAQLTERATLLQQKNDQTGGKSGQTALQLQEAQENAKRVAAENLQMSNRSHRVREFMEGAFHSFAPATVGPSDATVNGVMKAALNELKNGGFDDDLDAKSQLESTIATILMDGGEFSQAKPILDQVLQYRRSIHKTDNAELADAIGDASRVRILLGDLIGAEPLAQESLAMYQRLFSGDQLVVAASLSNLAQLERAQMKWVEAQAHCEQAIAMFMRLRAGNSWNLARELHELGELHDECGRLSDAQRLFEQSLTMKFALVQGDHPDIASGMTHLAGVHQSLGNFEQAEKILVKALEMQKNLHQGDNLLVADCENNLASVLQSLGRSAEAERFFRQALSMKERILKYDDPSIANGLTSLAFVEQAQGRNDLAEPLLVRALDMRKRLHPGDHSSTARTLNCLAWVMFDQGELNEAVVNSQAAVDMYSRTAPDGNAQRAVAIALRARIANKQGDTAMANELISQAQVMVLAKEPATGANAKAVMNLKDEIAGK